MINLPFPNPILVFDGLTCILAGEFEPHLQLQLGPDIEKNGGVVVQNVIKSTKVPLLPFIVYKRHGFLIVRDSIS